MYNSHLLEDKEQRSILDRQINLDAAGLVPMQTGTHHIDNTEIVIEWGKINNEEIK